MELCVEYDHQNNTSKYIDCELLEDTGADTEISVHVYFIGKYLYSDIRYQYMYTLYISTHL